MKKFEEMPPLERKAMILRAVASNISFEGHDDVARQFLNRADALKM